MSTKLSRRHLGKAASASLVGALFAPHIAHAAPPLIRYATAGGLGPNEIETVILGDWMRNTVLSRYNKDYRLDLTYAQATPQTAMMVAAGQIDMAVLTPPVFASTTAKDAVPGGMKIVADCYQDGHEGYASQAFYVLADSPIKTVADLRGKTVAVNAYGSTPDVVLTTVLKKYDLKPRRDLDVVEIVFPSIGPALRAKRVDCGVLPLPFGAIELAKGGIRPVFSGKDAFPPFTVIAQVATNDILHQQPEAVAALLADYVDALHWLYDPANRAQAVRVTAGITKSPTAVVDSYFLTKADYYRDPNACVSAQLLQPLVDAMAADGLLAAPLDMAKYVDTSFLPHPC